MIKNRGRNKETRLKAISFYQFILTFIGGKPIIYVVYPKNATN